MDCIRELLRGLPEPRGGSLSFAVCSRAPVVEARDKGFVFLVVRIRGDRQTDRRA